MLVFGGSRPGRDPRYAEEARRLGRGLAAAGCRIVTGGSRHGLMGAVTDAARESGGLTTGVVPVQLAAVQESHPDLEQVIVVDSLAERKTRMYELSDVCVALPGAIGTMDEITETLVLCELGQRRIPLVVVDVDRYWDPMFAMLERMVERGFLPDILRSIVVRVGSAEAAVEAVRTRFRPPAAAASGN